MRELIRYSKLYFLIIYLNLKARARYTINFAVALVQSFIVAASSVGMFWIVLDRFKDINGWDMYEIGFMLAMARIVFALNMTFFQQIWGMDMLINMGEIDKVLVRPKSPLFLFICQRFDIMWLGDLLSGILLLVFTGARVCVPWNAANILFLLLLIVCATLIYASIMFLAGATAFWFLRSRSVREFVFSIFMSFNPYPLSIYGKGIQFILSFVLPFAFIYYYPAFYFFKRGDNLFPEWIAFCSPVVTVVFLGLCGIMWCVGLKAYKSSGT